MTSKLSFVLFMALALVACTKDSEPLIESVVDQNEVNICQLKSMASDAGWAVTPKAMDGDRTTSLTEQEVNILQEDLNVYSLFPKTSESRQMEVVSFGNQYIFLPVFVPRVETKAASSGSIYVNTTYGYCFFNICNQISIKVCYDLDESGYISYAFGGAGSNFDGSKLTYCGNCRKATIYSTLYYKCSWVGTEVDLSLWLSRLTYHNVVDGSVDFTTSDRIYLFSKGHVNIKTGSSGFDTHEITEDELPPEIFTR